MDPIVIVGSGASGVHFALSVLRKGRNVTMIDRGIKKPEAVLPGVGFDELKEKLPDPVDYFLGEEFEGVVLPDLKEEFYGFPPSKQYVFEAPEKFEYSTRGFEPLFSFARGGLGEAWTGGCYPFNEPELEPFPFSFGELKPFYDEISRRIGITGEDDDLAQFLPLHEHLQEPLELDQHSSVLMDAYGRKRRHLNERLGCYIGRTRVATLSRGIGNRRACDKLGRCLWGCPNDSLYTPSQTLAECLTFPGFTYVPDMVARHFKVDRKNRATTLVASEANTGASREIPVGTLVLAAGTLSSSTIFLRSVLERDGKVVRLGGLMDNRQVLLPFVNLRMIGRQFDPNSYQYHLLGMGIETPVPREYVHGQITTLKTALMHPIVQKLPFDLRTSAYLASSLHASLGVVNVNFHDTRREESHVTLRIDGDRGPRLAMEYHAPRGEAARIRDGLRTVKKSLLKLGCIAPPGMQHVRPMGASVHYAGTLPMTDEDVPWSTTGECRSRDFENLFVVDGSTFPFLPAKNITFTLMANAARVAELAF